MKLALTVLIALALSGSALASQQNRTLTIRHQMHGCHSWSFDGATWRASQSTVLAVGATVTVVDNDVMPHTVLQVSGPKSTITGAAMKKMGAKARITFSGRGTYVFTTKAGEDYMKGVKTIGEDNTLRLVVKVS